MKITTETKVPGYLVPFNRLQQNKRCVHYLGQHGVDMGTEMFPMAFFLLFSPSFVDGSTKIPPMTSFFFCKNVLFQRAHTCGHAHTHANEIHVYRHTMHFIETMKGK